MREALQADVQQLLVAAVAAVVGLVECVVGGLLPPRWLAACLAAAVLLALALRCPAW